MEGDENVGYINKQLAKLYGYYDKDHQWYRVVFSTKETEVRFGQYNIFYGDIFVRRETGVKEVPKYWWCGENWIVEKYTIFPKIDNELMDNKRYEPIWILWSMDGKYTPLPLNWNVVKRIVHSSANPSKLLPSTQLEADYQKAITESRLIKRDREVLDQERKS